MCDKGTGYGAVHRETLLRCLCRSVPLTPVNVETSGYATWFTAGGAIRIAHYDVIDDVITGKL